MGYYYDWSPYMSPIKNQKDFDVGHVFAVIASMEFQYNKRRPLNSTSPWITFS
jgi:hypothetical protein